MGEVIDLRTRRILAIGIRRDGIQSVTYLPTVLPRIEDEEAIEPVTIRGLRAGRARVFGPENVTVARLVDMLVED